MTVKMGSSGGGASSHEGRVNPEAPMPMKQKDETARREATNNAPQMLYQKAFTEENFPTCDPDYSGTSDEAASRPATISSQNHETREQVG